MNLADLDFRRDEMDATSPCPKCGNREPVRLEEAGCNQCADFPRCRVCTRWTGDGTFLPKAVAGVCTVCIVKATRD